MEAYEGEHLSNILVYEFEHITKKGGMCVIKDSFSQLGWFHGSKVEWNTTERYNRMGYTKPFVPLMVTATYNILKHTLINSISRLPSIVVYRHCSWQNISTNGSPPKIPNMAPPGEVLSTQQCCEDNSESSENSLRTATGKDRQFRKQTNQYHQPHGYGYSPSQQPFPGAPQFHQHSPFNMTHSLQPTTSSSQGFPSYGPQWQGYDLHQGGYGGSQMFPPLQIPGQTLLSRGEPREPPVLPENHPANLPTSSSSNPPPEPPSSTPGRQPISLPTKRFQLAAQLRKTDVPGSADLPPLPEISYDDYDADDESHTLSDLGGAEGTPPISLK